MPGIAASSLKAIRILAVIVLAFGVLGYVEPALNGLREGQYCLDARHYPPQLAGFGEDVLGDFEQSFQLFPPGFVCTWQLPSREKVTHHPPLITESVRIAAFGAVLWVAANLALKKGRG